MTRESVFPSLVFRGWGEQQLAQSQFPMLSPTFPPSPGLVASLYLADPGRSPPGSGIPPHSLPEVSKGAVAGRAQSLAKDSQLSS